MGRNHPFLWKFSTYRVLLAWLSFFGPMGMAVALLCEAVVDGLDDGSYGQWEKNRATYQQKCRINNTNHFLSKNPVGYTI